MTSRQPNPEHQISSRALEHIQQLSVGIGPRPPGSDAEQEALNYLASKLKQAGLDPQNQPFSFAKPSFTPWTAGIGILFILHAALGQPPFVAVILPLALAAAPDLGRWSSRLARGKFKSSNIYAELPHNSTAPSLILCAHADSGKAAVLDSPFLLRLRSLTFDIAQRAALLLAVLGLAEFAGLELPSPFPTLTVILGMLVGAWLVLSESIEQLTCTGRFSPGANDNGSGAGLVLALAEYFARPETQRPTAGGENTHPEAHDGIDGPGRNNSSIRPAVSHGLPALGFLFTGAEEAGLHGARAFAQEMSPGTPVLSLDMVGSGNRLRYSSSDGVLHRLEADKHLNEQIQQADPHAEPLWYSLRSGDFAPFLEAGIPATGLQVTRNHQADLLYHTSRDTIDGIEPEALELTARSILKLMTLLQEQASPPPAD